MSSFTSKVYFHKHQLWKKIASKRSLVSFELELTPRCNNNCIHCYINLPTQDANVMGKELSVKDIDLLSTEAVSLGAIWCLLTGGEVLLREDFNEIYLLLKRKGLLVTIYTNGTMINQDHIDLFRKYPPRDIEITVYGVTSETYEAISRISGSYSAFRRGVDLLHQNGIKFGLKAMALKSNLHEFDEIIAFCEKYSSKLCRFDPFLHLRYDGHPGRNVEIKRERLNYKDVGTLDQLLGGRVEKGSKSCRESFDESKHLAVHNMLFGCGAGLSSFTVGYDGVLRLCSTLHHPLFLYDLRNGNLEDFWFRFIPEMRQLSSVSKTFVENCQKCALINQCMFCPAKSYLEEGNLDAHIDYFCSLAHDRSVKQVKFV